jgi:replicative DNA helicase
MEWTLGAETELRILAILRRSPYWEKYQSVVQPSFFSDDHTRHLFQLLQGYFERYPAAAKLSVPDWVALIRRYSRDGEYRQKCLELVRRIKKLDIPEPRFIEETVIEFARRQLVRTMVMEGIGLLDQPELNTEKLHAYLEQADSVRGVIETQVYDYFRDPLMRMQQAKEDKRLTTGIPELDTVLEGGFGKGELAVFLGTPGRGKTLALVNMGYAALTQGLPVFHATCEISARRTARRYDMRITCRTFSELKAQPRLVATALEKIKRNGGDLVIKDYSGEYPRVRDVKAAIVSYLTRLKRKPGLVIIDYADLLTATRGGRDHRFELKEIYDGLRRLAANLDVPIVTASQATRKSLQKITLTIEDFAEAFAKAAIADIVIALCQTPEEEEDGLIRLHIAKSRERPGRPTFRVTYDPDRSYLGGVHGLRLAKR